MSDSIVGILAGSNTPITDALIQRVMREHPGTSAKAQADYYEAVHQELAPLARDFEKEIARLKADMQSIWGNKRAVPQQAQDERQAKGSEIE